MYHSLLLLLNIPVVLGAKIRPACCAVTTLEQLRLAKIRAHHHPGQQPKHICIGKLTYVAVDSLRAHARGSLQQ
jgi:hypothetical protein